MMAVATLLCVVGISLLITRVATIALVHTGLSRESARFQARSAFTGVGFTTNESEGAVNHPVRRRVLMILMLLGNAGIVTVVASSILTFLHFEQGEAGFWNAALLASGLLVLWLTATSKWVDRRLSRWIGWALRRYTGLDTRDYASLLQLTGDYRVSELQVEDEDWIAGKTLSESGLRKEGINVLAIQHREGEFEGAPSGDTRLHAGDTLIAYCRVEALEALDRRRKGLAGDVEHFRAVAQRRREKEAKGASGAPAAKAQEAGS